MPPPLRATQRRPPRPSEVAARDLAARPRPPRGRVHRRRARGSPRAPAAARGLDVGADVADRRRSAPGRRRARAAARSTSPGAGLRQAQPSSGPCGQHCARRRTGRAAPRRGALTASTSSRREQPAGDAGLVGDDAERRRRAARSRVERLARARHRLAPAPGRRCRGRRRPACRRGRSRTAAGGAGAAAARRGGAARASRASSPAQPPGGGERHQRAGRRASSRPRARVARPGRDARPGELRRARPASRAPPRRPTRGGRRAASASAASAARRSRQVARGGGRAGRPARSRQPRPCSAAHQHVVGVAGLLAQRRPSGDAGRTGCTTRAPAARRCASPRAATRRPRSASSR